MVYLDASIFVFAALAKDKLGLRHRDALHFAVMRRVGEKHSETHVEVRYKKRGKKKEIALFQ